MRLLTAFTAAIALALPVIGMSAPQAGKDYRELSQPQPTDSEKTSVIEFFSYACPHCFDFHPLLKNWEASTKQPHTLRHVPVTFGRDSWAVLARAFYVAETLGVLDKTHGALFNALHVQGRRDLRTPEAIAEFYASLGVDRQEALDAFDSFAVNVKMKRAERLVRDYRIRSTPSLAVAGRFVTDPRSAGGQGEMLDVVEYLLSRN